MRYREFSPAEPLRPWVRCLWHLDRTYTPGQPTEIVWPHTSVELIVHFEDGYNGLPHAFVIGPLTRFVTLRSAGRVRLFGARLFPWGVARLFGQSLRELRYLVLPLDVLGATDARRLPEQLVDAQIPQAIAQLNALLLARLAASEHNAPSGVRALCAALDGGTPSAGKLAASAGLSLRQLERQFDDYVGVSPRQLVRITRFNRAREAVAREPTRNLLDIAFEHQYVDYSHMSREFREFLGVTPAGLRRWVRNVGELSGRGVPFSQEPKKMAWRDFAIFEDPDGNSAGLRPA